MKDKSAIKSDGKSRRKPLSAIASPIIAQAALSALKRQILGVLAQVLELRALVAGGKTSEAVQPCNDLHMAC